MKVVIVCGFETYEARVDMVYDFFKNRGDDVKVYVSDFCHMNKVYRNNDKEDYELIHAKEYQKNLSISRISSHYYFAKDVIKKVDEFGPELMYVLLPPNSLVKETAYYKKKHKDIKVIFDVIDLWPETMTIGKIKNIFPFTIWRALRDRNINCADHIITECNLFKEKLKEIVSEKMITTVYFASKRIESNIDISKSLLDNTLSLCYLGSINNIIDIDYIINIINSITGNVELHIIGDGEKKDEFLEKLKLTKAKVFYYGKIYDDNRKAEILKRCHFGLNIMKSTVCVGLTMKSVEYFRYGTPILNNIQGDTYDLVMNYNLGINWSIQKETKELMSAFDYRESINNIKTFFDNELSEESFKVKINKIVSWVN